MSKDALVIVNLSDRGDKDVQTVAGLNCWCALLRPVQ